MSLKKIHLLLLSGVITVMCTGVIPQQAVAQNGISVNVSAKVTSSIQMITLQSMQLSRVDAEDEIISIDPTTSPNAGKMVAYGNPNSDIRISYLQSRQLTRLNGTESITFNYQIAGNQQEDQNTAELLNLENRDLSFNEDGEFYLWIGGNVNISTAVPGNYQGEFTLEIEYI